MHGRSVWAGDELEEQHEAAPVVLREGKREEDVSGVNGVVGGIISQRRGACWV